MRSSDSTCQKLYSKSIRNGSKDPDTTAAEKALADADMAEKFVNETLASLKQK